MISESEKEGHAMWKAFVSLWKNIFNYKGKSGRKEFWLGIVMNVIMMYAGLIPVAILFLALNSLGLLFLISPVVFSCIYSAVFVLPLISLYIRRANDTGLRIVSSVLIALAVPVVGSLIVGLWPSNSGSAPVKLPWSIWGVMLGIALYIYGGLGGTLIFGSVSAASPLVMLGVALMTISIIVGAIIVKLKEKE